MLDCRVLEPLDTELCLQVVELTTVTDSDLITTPAAVPDLASVITQEAFSADMDSNKSLITEEAASGFHMLSDKVRACKCISAHSADATALTWPAAPACTAKQPCATLLDPHEKPYVLRQP